MKTLSTIFSLLKFTPLTEKSILLLKQNKYILLVDKALTKLDIKFFFETYFNLKLKTINICNLPTKTRKIKATRGTKASYKKVYITFTIIKPFLNYLKLNSFYIY
jgi:ribosomal protein L23